MKTSAPPASQILKSNKFHAQKINIQHNVNQTQTVHQARRDPLEMLLESVAFGAFYNSDERYDPPKCHPQTRIAVLDHIEQWATDTSPNTKPILWLSGPAGAGKSAIAQTLVERWKEMGVALLEVYSSISSEIETAINIGGIFQRNLGFQLDKLVVEPLRRVAIDNGERTLLIVVDGLDECCIDLPRGDDFPGQSYESQQQEILEAFSSACQKTPHLRILIVSRPERQIRQSFATSPLDDLTLPLSLKDVKDAPSDIRLFLNCKFQEIRKQYEIESSWPTEAQLSKIIEKSSGQFIYPSIVVKHITRARADPRMSLNAVLNLRHGSADNPLAELDTLYTLVLKSVLTTSLPIVTDILGYLLPYHADIGSLHMIFRSEVSDRSQVMFEKYLFLSEGEVNLHLTDLHSVMDIPSTTTGGAISFIHATFSEYLQDKSRSGDYFISGEYVHTRYTHLLFRHLHKWGPDLEGRIYVAGRLIACAYWWISVCPPSKNLMIQLWSLMSTELGPYPSVRHQMATDSLPLASKQLSTRFVYKVKDELRNEYVQDILLYLQKCNVPEVESSRWRRYLIHHRLSAALSKLTPYRDHCGKMLVNERNAMERLEPQNLNPNRHC